MLPSHLTFYLGSFGFALALLRAAPVAAHPMPYSAILLDFHRDGVSAEVILPLQELELGFKQPLLAHPEQVLSAHGPALREYLLAHVHLVAPDGRPWTVKIRDLDVRLKEQPLDLTTHLWLRPPPDAPLRQFTFKYDAIVHEVASHKTFVFVRNDWNYLQFRPMDKLPPMQEAIGLIRYLVYSVNIDRTTGSVWQGFGFMLTLGVRHIAVGGDSLLLWLGAMFDFWLEEPTLSQVTPLLPGRNWPPDPAGRLARTP